jgi:hypothetical protein
VHEKISYREFVDYYDTRIWIPTEASSIYVYSFSDRDFWDLRVVMDIPPEESTKIVAQIQQKMKWDPYIHNEATNIIEVKSGDQDGRLTVVGWESWDHEIPRWWRSISLDNYVVVALGVFGDTRYVWLFNEREHRLAMWRYFIA